MLDNLSWRWSRIKLTRRNRYHDFRVIQTMWRSEALWLLLFKFHWQVGLSWYCQAGPPNHISWSGCFHWVRVRSAGMVATQAWSPSPTVVRGSMPVIPGSITGIHPDDGCTLNYIRRFQDHGDLFETWKRKTCSIKSTWDPSHWQFNIGFDSHAAIQVLT